MCTPLGLLLVDVLLCQPRDRVYGVALQRERVLRVAVRRVQEHRIGVQKSPQVRVRAHGRVVAHVAAVDVLFAGGQEEKQHSRAGAVVRVDGGHRYTCAQYVSMLLGGMQTLTQ